MITNITTDDVRHMTDTEGLILQGCGGDPAEWQDGINELLTDADILLDGGKFENISVFEHEGHTNILFPFDLEPGKLDMGKLAMWRLQTHNQFDGTWLSDYISNYLGRSLERGEAEDVPPAEQQETDRGGKDNESNGKDTSDPPIQVYIENARDSSIGGFTIPFPTAKETLAPWLAAIRDDADDPFGIAIREVRSSIPGLEDVLQGFTDEGIVFDELNYLAAKIGGLNNWQAELFTAVLESGQYCGSVKDLINLTDNAVRFDLQPAFNEAQYGEFLIEMEKDISSDIFERLEKSEDSDERAFAQYILRLEKYVDDDAYACSVIKEENGVFTKYGYLVQCGEFSEVYRGPEDIPREYRLFDATIHVQEKPEAAPLRVVPPGIRSDEMLGRYLYDNKMLSEEHMEAANARLNYTAYPEDYYRLIGKRRREAENGSYGENGYVEKPSVLKQIAAARAEQRTGDGMNHINGQERGTKKKSYEPEV